MLRQRIMHPVLSSAALLLICGLFPPLTSAQSASTDDAPVLPIADAHVHYSHDSVELTPPERVIEIMRNAELKFALVSSSDDNGTQLLSALAPDLIVPGLRPYRRRGELSSWFTDPDALAYVEALLAKNRYASIGEFHLYGDDVELPIPQRIVQLADEHNLILHAHSDADAVDRILAQNQQVKVLWAHAGFDAPEDIQRMLDKHDRLWADLAFRSEVGSGGSLSDDWRALFTAHPDRIMLGTDTYTPERMYYIPEHANGARTWLSTLPQDLAANLAWKNAFNLIMPVWQKNNVAASESNEESDSTVVCEATGDPKQALIEGEKFSVLVTPTSDIKVSEPFSVNITVCSDLPLVGVKIDATMPAHGHGMNYTPELTELNSSNGSDEQPMGQYLAEGMVFHMPGEWQWQVELQSAEHRETLMQKLQIQ